jgi:periplasmic protein CpxP/Spy
MKTFAMFGVMLLAAGPAFAQTATTGPAPTGPAPTGPAPTGSVPKAPAVHAAVAKAPSMEARVEQRIVQMHQRLKITAAQQPAWDGFAQMMRENVTSIDQAYTTRRTTVATMSAPDNMRNFAQIEQDRAAGIQKLATSFQTLYDGMSDEQKQTADAMFRNYGERGGMPKKTSK